jgi:peptidoglycan LD-endopeptidase CwlK
MAGLACEERLVGVHPYLAECVMGAAAEFNFQQLKHDNYLTVIEGLRTVERQRELLAKGASWAKHSLHLKQLDGFAHAVDIGVVMNGQFVQDGSRIVYQSWAKCVKDYWGHRYHNARLKWGGDWKVVDAVHWQIELPGVAVPA